MKKTLLAAAAATATLFAAAPVLAGDLYAPNGFIGADYGYDHVKIGGAGADVSSYGLSGSTDVKLGQPQYNLELDADYAHVSPSEGIGEFNTGGADAHVFYRDEHGAYGVMGGAHTTGDVTVGDVGVEGARFFQKFTVLGDWTTHWTDTGPKIHVSTIDLGGRYFLTDNFRVDTSAGYVRPDVLGKYSDGWNVGLGGEYRLAASPVSFYARVEHTDFGQAIVRDNTVRVGLRWNFGGSLKARDRDGATFAPTGGDDAFERLAGLLY